MSSIFQTLAKATEHIVNTGNRAVTSAASSAPKVPAKETAAATFESSSQCVLADQQKALRSFGLGPASSAWKNSASEVQFAGAGKPKGKPENWGETKQDLVTYLNGAQHRTEKTTFSDNKSKGFAHLDQSGKEDDPTASIRTYLAPGSLTVSMHGIRPILEKDTNPHVNPERNRTPFWDGTEPNGLRTTAEVAEMIRPHLKEGDDTPVFLNVCNAGTELNGIVPAADLSRRLGRYIIAPVDSRILGSVSGPQLNDEKGEWRVFHPDGTSELLYKPTNYPGYEKPSH